MKKKSTMEVCAELGVSRTTFKGWVYDILGRTQDPYDNTTLEFTEEEIITLWQIRFYKQLKYSNSKIKAILNDPHFDMSRSLTFQIKELTKQKEEMEKLIKVASVMKETGITPTSVRFGLDEAGELKYDHILTLLGTMSDNMVLLSEKDANIPQTITEEDADKLQKCFEKIMRLSITDVSPSYDLAQKTAKEIHTVMSKYITESVLVFSWNILCFAPGTEYARDIDNEYGKGSAEFLFNVLQAYCSLNSDNDFDKDYVEAVDNIERLGYKKHSARSEEVQAEVDKLYRFVKKLNRQPDKICIKIFRNFGEMFGTDEYRNAFDNGAKRGIAWFISRAIEIFCDNAEAKTKEVK